MYIRLIIILLILCALAAAGTLTIKTIFWNNDDVQICKSYEVDPNLVECSNLKYADLLNLMAQDWLKKDSNSLADLYPDGTIDMQDFSVLSQYWRSK